MFLVDTNVWLELLLEQDKASQVRQFMQTVEGRLISISEFSLYSIGIILTRLMKDTTFRDCLSDTWQDSGIGKARLETSDLEHLLDVRKQFNLDFDDAYQYVAGEKYNLTLVSFDKDFDRTARGRQTPAQAVNSISKG